MNDPHPSKNEVLNPHAPPRRAIDLTRDGDLLARLGLGIDAVVDQLGGSAW